MTGNREYKSDVFSMLLEDKARALDVYNALTGKNYTDPEIIEIRTLEKGVSLTVRNDASFIVDSDMTLNIYEHQSTYNPNMPLRQLIYFVTLVKDMLDEQYVYSRKLVRIPTPKFAVFYNGNENRPETEILKLSDSFMNRSEEPELELSCMVYNINPGNNARLLDKCPTLQGYMRLVEYVRNNLEQYGRKKENYAKAIREAIDRCIEEGMLVEFFEKRREEVEKAMVFDFTYEKQMENAKKEWYSDGVVDGIAQGITQGIAQGITQGENRILINLIIRKIKKEKTLSEIAEELERTESELAPVYETVMRHAPEYDEDRILEDICQKVQE